MNPEAMGEALNAIHVEAVKLLALDPSEEIKRGLHLIISLARYKLDVRTDEEKGTS